MKNRHALIDPQTGLVRNVIIWEGAPFLPPKDHYVVHDCDGQIGDYWHQDSNCFYTVNGKRRFRDEQGKIGEHELNEHEKKHVEPRLKDVYEHACIKHRWKETMDLTREDVPVPKLLQDVVSK